MLKNGYILIISVIMVAVVGTVVMVTLTLLSIGATETSGDWFNIYKAKAYANACTESAMVRIRDEDFVGTGTLLFETDSCIYEVLNTGGETRELRATGLAGGAYSRIKLLVSALSPDIVFSKKEVDDF